MNGEGSIFFFLFLPVPLLSSLCQGSPRSQAAAAAATATAAGGPYSNTLIVITQT